MAQALFGYGLALLMFANAASVEPIWLAIIDIVLGGWIVIAASINGYLAARDL